MTDIEFHFNVPDKLLYSCRLLRKAYASGARVVVTAEPEVLGDLDQLLWSFSPTEFVPHCRLEARATTLAGSPVVLTETLQGVARDGVLVSLSRTVPPEFERFERFIELVTQDVEDRIAARERWKHYADRGYALKRHDLATTGEGA